MEEGYAQQEAARLASFMLTVGSSNPPSALNPLAAAGASLSCVGADGNGARLLHRRPRGRGRGRLCGDE